jgi:hypothetical protein
MEPVMPLHFGAGIYAYLHPFLFISGNEEREGEGSGVGAVHLHLPIQSGYVV